MLNGSIKGIVIEYQGNQLVAAIGKLSDTSTASDDLVCKNIKIDVGAVVIEYELKDGRAYWERFSGYPYVMSGSGEVF